MKILQHHSTNAQELASGEISLPPRLCDLQPHPVTAPSTLVEAAAVLRDTKRVEQLRSNPVAIGHFAEVVAKPVNLAVEAVLEARYGDVSAWGIPVHCRERIPELLTKSPIRSLDLTYLVNKLVEEHVERHEVQARAVRAILNVRKPVANSDRPGPSPNPEPSLEFALPNEGHHVALEAEIEQLFQEHPGVERLAQGEGDLSTPAEQFNLLSPELEDAAQERLRARELSHAFRLEDYNQAHRARILELASEQFQIPFVLYFFNGLRAEEIALLTGLSQAVVEQGLQAAIRSITQLRAEEKFWSPGEAIAREIDRDDLKLKECEGITLCKDLMQRYPSLRESPEILCVLSDGLPFFNQLLEEDTPNELESLRAAVSGPSGELALELLPSLLRQLIINQILHEAPTPESFRYLPEYEKLLPTALRASSVGPMERTEILLKKFLELGIYNSKVSPASPLSCSWRGDGSGPFILNPLLRAEFVGTEQARDNREKLAGKLFKNLDVVLARNSHYGAICSMLDLPPRSPIADVQRAMISQGLLRGVLPEGYFPSAVGSAYFDAAIVGQAQARENAESYVRRRWGHLDDVEPDKVIAAALGVKNGYVALLNRVAPIFGTSIPDRHPLNYRPRGVTNYVAQGSHLTAEQRAANLRKALEDTFGTMENVTLKGINARVGVRQLAAMLDVKPGVKEILTEIRSRALLPDSKGRRGSDAPLPRRHVDKGPPPVRFKDLPPGLQEATKRRILEKYPTAESLRYDAELGGLFDVARGSFNSTVRHPFHASWAILKKCLQHGIYSPQVHNDSTLSIRWHSEGKSRAVRNPLLEPEIVGPERAAENRGILIRRTWPTLDDFGALDPHRDLMKNLLGVSPTAPVSTLRRALVSQGYHEPHLPADYAPTMAGSAYFDSRVVGPEVARMNAAALVRRNWSHLDQVERNAVIADALGVPNKVSALIPAVAKIIGARMPVGHPLNYHYTGPSYYLRTDVGLPPELVTDNLRQALGSIFGTMNNLNTASILSALGIGRLSSMLQVEERVSSIVQAVRNRGLLPA